MVDKADISLGNVFGGFDMGLGTMGNVLLIFFLAILILGLIGVGIFFMIQNKKLKHKIPLLRKVGNSVIRIGYFKARDYKIGNAGDKLWYIPKIKKFLPPATIQTAPNEYTHFEREDGEWVNIGLPDVDEKLKQMNVKYVHQDMRANRIAISNILESRFTKRGFWDKYGQMIMNVIFYLVVAIAMVVIFYQWSGIVEKTAGLVDKLDTMIKLQQGGGENSIVPALIGLFTLKGVKRRWVLAKH